MQLKVSCKIGDDLILVDLNLFADGEKLDSELLKIEVACRYYLKLYDQRRTKGMC